MGREWTRRRGRRPSAKAVSSTPGVGYSIEYSPDVEGHLRLLDRRQQNVVLDGVYDQLRVQPAVETRNRKRLQPNETAPWELRLGSLRVYYDVVESPGRRVIVHAVGVKDRNLVRIGGEVVEL